MYQLLTGLGIGIVLVGFAIYGTMNEWGSMSALIGLAGFAAAMAGMSQHAQNFRHVQSYPVERRQKRTKVPKHKERRKYAESTGIKYRGNIQIRGRKIV